jgi:hypothetical protein
MERGGILARQKLQEKTERVEDERQGVEEQSTMAAQTQNGSWNDFANDPSLTRNPFDQTSMKSSMYVFRG